ncbi:hypothetical protein E4U41_006148 [Claviceps citrina]|nr:hypothetical protein E4U41_006148 [Claviceps citrina]
MHLLLVRHAESVDNVAGLYGGSRDATLTAHGTLQARRLASDLASASGLDIRHIFSSPLRRAAQTAGAICEACNDARRSAEEEKHHRRVLSVVPVSQLREKHYGNWEGVKCAAASSRPPQTGAETPEAMRTRAVDFLDHHLWPVLSEMLDLGADMADKACVVVVSHGILLGTLTRTLLGRLGRGGSSPGASLTEISSHRLSWSNTGYLDLKMAMRPPATPSLASSSAAAAWSSLHCSISHVNCTRHLAGLHKTRGGIGSAAHDGRQKTLEGFFTTGVAASRKRKADAAAAE